MAISLTGVALIASTVIILFLAIRRYVQDLRFFSHFHTPGPLLPIFGHLWQASVITQLKTLRLNYPDKRVLAVNVIGMQRLVLVCHPETVEPVLKNSKFVDRTILTDVLKPALASGLLTSLGETWRSQRKALNPIYRSGMTERSLEIVNKNGDLMWRTILDDLEDKGQPILDVTLYLYRFLIRTVLEVGGESDFELSEDIVTDVMNHLIELEHILSQRLLSPWLWPDWLFNLTPAKTSQDRCLEVVITYVSKVIAERRNTFPKHLPFLDLIENLSMTEKEVTDQLYTFLVGALLTTPPPMSWTLLLLANHKDVQDKVMEEQQQIFTEQSEHVTREHLGQMKYLECCIKEALRLYPAVPFTMRDVDQDGMIIDGVPIPKGAMIVVSFFDLHRNPGVWEAPLEFRPERFMAGGRAGDERHPCAYIPFSAGTRNCIGQQFAMLNMKVTLSKLLRQTELMKADHWEDVEMEPGITLRPKGRVDIRFGKRKFPANIYSP